MALSLISTQIIAAMLLLVSTFLIGTVPSLIGSKVKKKRADRDRTSTSNGSTVQNGHNGHVGSIGSKNRRKFLTFQNTLSFLMNFGAGVLFATCFVHMLPEAQESFESIWSKKANPSENGTTVAPSTDDGDDEPSIPRAEFVICAGFFLIFLVEEIAHGIVSKTHGHDQKDYDEDMKTATTEAKERRPSRLSNNSLKDLITADSINYGSTSIDDQTSINDTSTTICIDTVVSNDTSSEIGQLTKDPIPLLRCLLIVIALSFHSIFDGLAIGLQRTVNHVWQLFFAISLHKSLIAFVVGLDVFSETMSFKRVVVYMLPFSIVSPIGVLVAAYTKLSVGDKTNAILSAIATGSLLYITFFELMFRERASKKGVPGYVQLVAVALGFVLFSVISTLMPA